MWSAYAPRDGVVVKSSFARLSDALDDSDRAVFIGCIRYADIPTEESMPDDDYVSAAFLKSPQFEDEREVRALVDRGELFHDPSSDEKSVHDPGTPDGEDVPASIPTLIEEVRLSPGSHSWQLEVIRVLAERYGFPSIQISQSELDIKPQEWLADPPASIRADDGAGSP
jgi:hypothetical protein